jgi:nucleoid DNA-binding protein
MKIERHISDLLYRYQCVTIPGFGAFITETHSAQVNESAHVFVAPKKSLFFNANIKNNDGLLIHHVAQQENISFEKASAKVETRVNHWLTLLQSEKSLVIENIGSIAVNEENNWIFEAATSVNYLTSAFGLSNFSVTEIKRIVEQKEVISLEKEAIKEEKVMSIVSQKTNSYAFLKYAAAFALFFGGGMSVVKVYVDQQAQTQTLLVQKNVQAKVQQRIQQATFFINSPETSVAIAVTEEVMPFHVIAGAFRSEKNAEKALNILLEEGYKAHVLPRNKYSLTPVAYGSYSTLEEAENLKQKLINQGDDQAWLLID